MKIKTTGNRRFFDVIERQPPSPRRSRPTQGRATSPTSARYVRTLSLLCVKGGGNEHSELTEGLFENNQTSAHYVRTPPPLSAERELK